MLSVVLGAALVVVLVRHVVVDIRGKKAVLGDSIRLVSKVADASPAPSSQERL